MNEVLTADPGTAFQYSNTNFCILGLLIEKATGEPFEKAIHDRVLSPIGISAHLAPTFDTQVGDAVHASSPGRNYMEALGPAGGWVATPTDVAKLAAALRDDAATAALDERTVDSMRVPVPVPVEIPPPANGWSYGLGLMLFPDGSWGHTGTIESTHSIVINRPDGLTVSVMVSGKRPIEHRPLAAGHRPRGRGSASADRPNGYRPDDGTTRPKARRPRRSSPSSTICSATTFAGATVGRSASSTTAAATCRRWPKRPTAATPARTR